MRRTNQKASDGPKYRVEHHDGRGVQMLGVVTDGAPHPSTLDLYLGRLLRAGAEGQLVLIDEASGRVVARRQVRPFRGRWKPPSGAQRT
jgi:hypothetical protein